MKEEKVLVQAKHIGKGITHYKGKPAPRIQTHLENIGWKYTAYRFEDGRVLLVYPDASFGILYSSSELLYQEMEKERQKTIAPDSSQL